jgi:hypothetical protein
MKRLILSALLFLLSVSAALAAGTTPSYVELADAPTITVDWSKGDTQAVTLHGNRAFVFINGLKGGTYRLIIKQDATGSRTVTWPLSVHWPTGGMAIGVPTLTTKANKKDYLSFFCDGESYDAIGIVQRL